MKQFKNKVVVISGAGSGIGRALAVAFAKQGAKLALNDLKPIALNVTAALVKKEGAQVFETSFDVSNKESVAKFAEEVAKHYGQTDVVINNAGIGLGDYLVHEVDLNLFERVMNINFYGVLYGSHYFIPHLLKQPESSLVNISSVFGLTGIGRSGAYCASKFAVHGLNQCLWNEYADTNLTVHSVHPGGINTNITQNSLDYQSVSDTKLHDAFQKEFLKLSPDYAAQTIINGIRKKKRKILIGAEAHQLDLATRIAPFWGNRAVNKIIKQKLAALTTKFNT